VRRLALLFVALLLAGCGLPAPAPATTTPTTSTPVSTTPPPVAIPTPFSGERALADLRAQVLAPDGSIRHRVPGTSGNDEAARIVAENLTSLGWNVTFDRWSGQYGCRDVPMHNVVAQRNGTSGRVVLLGAHYDTRPVAESDADAQNRTLPIPGAGDGASGVAVLLELARSLPPTSDSVRLVFFDAEDGGDMGDGCTDWLLGSRHYAENLSTAEVRDIKAMVLVDLVSDPNMTLPRELATYTALGRGPQDHLYAIAGGLGQKAFSNETRVGETYSIEDDHVPFRDRGIPAVDLIDLRPGSVFPEWHHTQHDDLDHVSARSLEAVGLVLQRWLAEGALSGP